MFNFIYRAQYLPSLIISLITTHNDFDSADPSSMEDTCELSLMTLLSMICRSSVDRAMLGKSWVRMVSGTHMYEQIVGGSRLF